jgi:hypothetical protein
MRISRERRGQQKRSQKEYTLKNFKSAKQNKSLSKFLDRNSKIK